jgi:calcineurin-like phosphoesterase family protein
MRWFVSDLHFFHKLCHWKYRSNNSTIEDMNEEIVYQWNKQVKSQDVVFVIGDVTFGKYEETKALVQRLKGKKILIRGNHDERFSSKDWIDIGFDDVRDTFVFKKNGAKWILSHFPYSSSFKYFWYRYIKGHNEAGYYKLYLPFKSYSLVHGHHHSGPVYKPFSVNVAWDIHKRLIDENEIEKLFMQNPSGFKKFIATIKMVFWPD